MLQNQEASSNPSFIVKGKAPHRDSHVFAVRLSWCMVKGANMRCKEVQSWGVESAISLHHLQTHARATGELQSCTLGGLSGMNAMNMLDKVSGGIRSIGPQEGIA
ncbi:hypothetical protein FIBSPDRAFT_872593 [Athelia psychrophila]|uniref:Uncharacterized protein n=1 Tax=Athelia psychrophila TaxID=1759441 RepID=A0A165ZEQ8_9AGAM|nr:hypothetical protein FIBSPDRAFT_872593 [Fibularhizoctonia sp. CBS 109695]